MYDAMMQWLSRADDLSLGSSMVLSLVFFAASFVLIPRTFLCLGVGAVFGIYAVLIILPSTTLGGILAFLTARHLLSKRMQVFITSRPGLRRIADAVDAEGWRIVALLRFASPLPNAVQNYMFGLTRIQLLPFSIATFFFTTPQVVLYVYLGSAGRSLVLGDGLSILNRVLLGAGLISVALAVSLIIRRVRRDQHLSLDQ